MLTLKNAMQACGVRRRRCMQMRKNCVIRIFSFLDVRASSLQPMKNFPNTCTCRTYNSSSSSSSRVVIYIMTTFISNNVVNLTR